MKSSYRFMALAAAASLAACSVDVDLSGAPKEDKPAAAEPRNCDEAKAKLAAANKAVIETGTAYSNANVLTRDEALRAHIDAKVQHLGALLSFNTLCPQL